MEYTIIRHDKCGWQSEPMDRDKLTEIGIPWYCDRCGTRAVGFVKGTLDELREWQRQQEVSDGHHSTTARFTLG